MIKIQLHRALIFLIASIFSSCSKNESAINIYDAYSVFSKSQIHNSSKNKIKVINICKSIGNNWDSIYVVSPYTPESKVRDFELNNFNDKIKIIVHNQEISETTNTILVIKNNTVTGYCIIPTSLVDFTYKNNGINNSWILNNKCDGIEAREVSYKGNKSYLIHMK